MRDVRTLQSFAKHYKTEEPIPEKLVHDIQRSRDSDRAEEVLDYVLYSMLSLKLYDSGPSQRGCRSPLFQGSGRRIEECDRLPWKILGL